MFKFEFSNLQVLGLKIIVSICIETTNNFDLVFKVIFLV